MLEVSSDLDTILRKHARIKYPLDKAWKKAAVTYCAERLGDIQAFRALGLQAIKDPERRALIAKALNVPGNENATPDDIGFNAWLLNECIGERVMSADNIFMRCSACFRVRTSRNMSRGTCKCGGMRLTNCVGQLETQEVLGRLAMGY